MIYLAHSFLDKTVIGYISVIFIPAALLLIIGFAIQGKFGYENKEVSKTRKVIGKIVFYSAFVWATASAIIGAIG